MCTRLYVGNLPLSIHEDHLRRLFGIFGVVASAEVVRDPITRRSQGYGFVEMPNETDAEHAIGVLDEMIIGLTPIRVCKASLRWHAPAMAFMVRTLRYGETND